MEVDIIKFNKQEMKNLLKILRTTKSDYICVIQEEFYDGKSIKLKTKVQEEVEPLERFIDTDITDYNNI